MKRIICLVLTAALLASCLTAFAAEIDMRYETVSGGLTHSLMVKSDGTVWAWGSNADGQLGLSGDVPEATKPVRVEGLSQIVEVAAGYSFSAALTGSGLVYVWGNGQSSPRVAQGLTQVVTISAGQTDILALCEDGMVRQFSIGKTPALVPALPSISAISAGSTHYMALAQNGEVYTWGSNWEGQLGSGTAADSSAPQKVPALRDIIDIAAGTTHCLALAGDGTVYSWGSNIAGELGNDSLIGATAPQAVKTDIKMTKVAAGNQSSLSISTGGDVYVWGYGEYGQHGNGAFNATQLTPRKVSSISSATFISSGAYHNLCVTERGAVFAWGRNKNYQIGNNKNANLATPAGMATEASVGESYILEGMSYYLATLNSASSWAQPELRSLLGRSVVSPYFWGNYQANISRAEFAHLLVSLYERHTGTVVAAARNNFTDITNHTFQQDILKAVTLEIMNGTSATTASPDNRITRQEAAKMLCCFVGKMKNTTISYSATSLDFYNDAGQVATWAVPYVAYAYHNDIMKGTGGGFSPTSNITFEQSLLVIERMFVKNGW